MVLEAVLAYAHLLAVLSWVVFIASTTALAREQWFNAAALARLARVDRIASVGAVAVLLTGVARVVWGAKGLHWYLGQPLLWLKLVLWLVLVVVGVGASRRIQAWHRACLAGGALPPLPDVAALRRRVFGVSHLLVVIPALAVCLARGIGTR
jgi:putative membrane protein